MRIILIVFAFICLHLNAQEYTKSALTAGSEFLGKNGQQNKSITLNEMVTCPFDVITKPNNQYIAKLPQSVDVVSSQKTNPILYLIFILLIGFSIHFFTSKKEITYNSQINFEEEAEQQRKKELWDAMAESSEKTD